MLDWKRKMGVPGRNTSTIKGVIADTVLHHVFNELPPLWLVLHFEFITAPESTRLTSLKCCIELKWTIIVYTSYGNKKKYADCRKKAMFCCLTWVIHQYFKVSVGVETLRAPFNSSLVQKIHATCWRTLLSIRHAVLFHHEKPNVEVDVFRLLERRKLNAIPKKKKLSFNNCQQSC